MTEAHRREPEPGERLICPNHGDEAVRLVECEDEEDTVECPLCEYACQNFLKYPVAQVTNRNGEQYLKNVLTGEIIQHLEPTAPWSVGRGERQQKETGE